ncbi:MAG: methyltransferase domain-containing protein [Candidatus Zixiibacteriota bacterium]
MNLIDICKPDFAANISASTSRKIPWDDPEFSRRMLAEHLSQAHDLASRRQETIDQHIDWLQSNVLSNGPARILDLGCGPGFYAERLADLGHTIRGIDFSPASIAYAKENSRHKNSCEYIHADIRAAEFGENFDAAFLIYGEFNVFSPDEAKALLQKMYHALIPGGRIVIEGTVFNAISGLGVAGPSWLAAQSGLFSDTPHIVLMTNSWNDELKYAEQQFTVIDAETAEAESFRSVTQAYTTDDFLEMLSAAGFSDCSILPAWGKDTIEDEDIFVLLHARK